VRRPRAERHQGIERLRMQQADPLLGGLDADHGRVGGLGALAVRPGGLAKRRGIPEHIEQSSWIWKARPIGLANAARASCRRGSSVGAHNAAMSTLAWIRAPVLRACISSTWATSRRWPVYRQVNRLTARHAEGAAGLGKPARSAAAHGRIGRQCRSLASS